MRAGGTALYSSPHYTDYAYSANNSNYSKPVLVRAWRIRTLLGRRDDLLLQLLARQLAEKIGAHSPLPILLCCALAGGAARNQSCTRHELYASTGTASLPGLVGLVLTALSTKAPPGPER